MFKLSFKRGQTSLELFILMLVVMLGAAVVATEMSKVSFESNTTTDIKYTTLGAFATGGSFVYNDHSGKNTGGYDKDNEKDLEDLLKNETKDKDKDGDKDVYELGEGSLYIELVGNSHALITKDEIPNGIWISGYIEIPEKEKKDKEEDDKEDDKDDYSKDTENDDKDKEKDDDKDNHSADKDNDNDKDTEDKNNDEKDKSSNKEYLYNANGTISGHIKLKGNEELSLGHLFTVNELVVNVKGGGGKKEFASLDVKVPSIGKFTIGKLKLKDDEEEIKEEKINGNVKINVDSSKIGEFNVKEIKGDAELNMDSSIISEFYVKKVGGHATLTFINSYVGIFNVHDKIDGSSNIIFDNTKVGNFDVNKEIKGNVKFIQSNITKCTAKKIDGEMEFINSNVKNFVVAKEIKNKANIVFSGSNITTFRIEKELDDAEITFVNSNVGELYVKKYKLKHNLITIENSKVDSITVEEWDEHKDSEIIIKNSHVNSTYYEYAIMNRSGIFPK
ncbi:MAG: hypothetical protein PWQ47_1029 [Methanothermococcus sp.]|nr:hypothetical protein [Methanothermococcus sp.]